jgi:hypothetical protein
LAPGDDVIWFAAWGGVRGDEIRTAAAARASVSRPSEGACAEARLLLLGESAGACAANSLSASGADVLHPQFHTSLHWQGFSKAATANAHQGYTRLKIQEQTLLAGVSWGDRGI